MAYRSKRRYRSSRFSRRRRNYRSRWFNRRRRRYGYKSSRRSKRKVEYKRVEFGLRSQFHTEVSAFDDVNFQVVYQPLSFACIGSAGPPNYGNITQGKNNPCIGITMGSGVNQRIGAKISPTRLRITGTVQLLPIRNIPTIGDAGEYEPLSRPQRAYVRFIVYQVRNGNVEHEVNSKFFSGVNPYMLYPLEFGISGANGSTKLNVNNNPDVKFWPSTGIFGRLFAKEVPHTESASYNTVNNQINVRQGYSLESRQEYSQMLLCKMPYRNGIGPNMRILKDKLICVNMDNTSGYSFRFKTKKPARMVWPESGTDNAVSTIPRNPIYLLAIPIFPYPTYTGRIMLETFVQMHYTDS